MVCIRRRSCSRYLFKLITQYPSSSTPLEIPSAGMFLGGYLIRTLMGFLEFLWRVQQCRLIATKKDLVANKPTMSLFTTRIPLQTLRNSKMYFALLFRLLQNWIRFTVDVNNMGATYLHRLKSPVAAHLSPCRRWLHHPLSQFSLIYE